MVCEEQLRGLGCATGGACGASMRGQMVVKGEGMAEAV